MIKKALSYKLFLVALSAFIVSMCVPPGPSAEDLAEKLKDAKVNIITKAGEKGKIFGSVNNIQLANSLKALGFEIERKNIQLKEENIKSLGTYSASVRLYKKIEVTIDFEVLPEIEE